MSGDKPVTISDEQLDRLADLLAIRLAAARPAAPTMLTVEEVSATFKVSRAWVYENAGRLGGVKLGPGQRAPLRFEARRVAAALSPLADSEQTSTSSEAPKRADRRRSTGFLPVYDG